jgi:rhodanese-related sulfurtransferase
MQNILEKSGILINGIRFISPKEAFELIGKGVILIDIRETYMRAYKAFQTDNIAYFPFSQFDQLWEQIPREHPVIIADATGLKSKQAVRFLMEKGYLLTASMNGGIMDWEKDGLPLTTEKKEQLSGACPCMLKAMNKLEKKHE